MNFFFLYESYFLVMSLSDLCLTQDHKDFLLGFCSRHCIFRPMIQFEWIFIYSMKCSRLPSFLHSFLLFSPFPSLPPSVFLPFSRWTSDSVVHQHLLNRDCLFSTELPLYHWWKSVWLYVQVHFWTLFCSIKHVCSFANDRMSWFL